MMDKENGRASPVVVHNLNESSGGADSARSSLSSREEGNGEANMFVGEKPSPPILPGKVRTGVDAVSKVSSDNPQHVEPSLGFSTCLESTFQNAFGNPDCTVIIDSEGVVWCFSTKTHALERLRGL